MSQRSAIMCALDSGLHRTRDIAAAAGVKREHVQVRLAELQRDGIVSAFRTLTGHKHGNEKFYRIRS